MLKFSQRLLLTSYLPVVLYFDCYTELEVAAELIELQVILARWQYNLVRIWDNKDFLTI